MVWFGTRPTGSISRTASPRCGGQTLRRSRAGRGSGCCSCLVRAGSGAGGVVRGVPRPGRVSGLFRYARRRACRRGLLPPGGGASVEVLLVGAAQREVGFGQLRVHGRLFAGGQRERAVVGFGLFEVAAAEDVDEGDVLGGVQADFFCGTPARAGLGRGRLVVGLDGDGLGGEELPSGPQRRGAGSMPAACRISQTVDGAMGCPSRAGSPWMRRRPQRGFSRARRSTRFFSAVAVGGRPVGVRRAE